MFEGRAWGVDPLIPMGKEEISKPEGARNRNFPLSNRYSNTRTNDGPPCLRSAEQELETAAGERQQHVSCRGSRPSSYLAEEVKTSIQQAELQKHQSHKGGSLGTGS